MKKYSRAYASIQLDAILHNIKEMSRALSPGAVITPVVKADGYGHGAVPIAAMLEPYEYIWGFAVATVEEALILRRHGIKKPVLILGYTFEEHYEDIVVNDIYPTVFKLDMAKKLSKAAADHNKTVHFHLAVDTGMSRIGFQTNGRSVQIIKEISMLPNIALDGIFTHFARADEEDKTFTYVQLERFLHFIDMLEEHQIHIPLKHTSNSAGLIDIKEAHMNMVRVGISCYGLYPSDEVNKKDIVLIPALELKSRIVYIQNVDSNVGISYGSTYITTRPTKIATIPVGYADGYPRSLSNKGWVLIRGQKAPILGRICMDQFMVDVTDIQGVQEDDEVVLIGKSLQEIITIEVLAGLSGRFHYEFVCDLGKRIPRIYIQNNQRIEEKDYFDE